MLYFVLRDGSIEETRRRIPVMSSLNKISTDQLGNRAEERGEALPMRPTARGLAQHGVPPG
jgi:hypothetical protein